MVIGFVKFKGGTGSSHAVMLTAFAFADRGNRVLVVDADPQGTISLWADMAGDLDVTVVQIASARLDQRIERLAADYDVVLIDGPPQRTDITQAIMRASDFVVVPTPPSVADLAQTWPTLDEAQRLGVPAAVLLTLVRLGTRTLDAARAALADREVAVLPTEARMREAVKQAFGTRPATVWEFADVATDLEEIGRALEG